MTQSFTDITNQLPLSKLTSEEMAIILSGLTGGSSFNPEEPNIVCYGNSFRVTYKSGTRKIIKITASIKYWEANKTEILKKLQNSANPEEEQIYSRVVFTSSEELNIPPFSWNDSFQLGRVPDGNPKPPEQWSLHPCLFQFKVPITGDLRLDQFRGEEIFRRTFLPLIPLLRQYCTTHLQFDDNSSSRKAWALTATEKDIDSEWVQLGYFLKKPVGKDSFISYSETGTKQLPVFKDDPLWLSSVYLSAGYSAYESLSDDEKKLFLLGCEWLNKAITANEKTDSFLFIMIMLEIFLPKDSTTCGDCGQSIYSINKRFKTYIPEIIGKDWTKEFETTLGKLYTLRSRIAHSGIAIGQSSSGLMPVEIKERNQLRYSFELARQFLVSWLFVRSKSQQDDSKA